MDKDTSCPPCQEFKNGTATLEEELTHLRRHLDERSARVEELESQLDHLQRLQEQANIWRDKYERLYESYERTQKLNQTLEERLLNLAERARGDKNQLSADVATLSLRLAHAKHTMQQMQKENERYKNDMNLAIQLLQCKPDNFVSHKLDNLPPDTQSRVSHFVMSKTKPSSPSLPTKNGNEEPVENTEYDFNVSASLMSKILEDSMQDTVTKHCQTCTCSKSKGNLFSYDETHYSVATQTLLNGEMKNSLCLNCNGDLKSTRSTISNRSGSPQTHRLINEVRSSPKLLKNTPLMPTVVPVAQEKNVKENDILNDRIKSEEKRTLTASVQREIVKKIGDELDQMKLTMEPATHHRLCDRTKGDVIEEPPKQEYKEDRKNSFCSNGGISRASSVAKSSASTHKSNIHVGPGPRFCSLRVQAGSKNILLDNAQADVPPVLYTRSRCSADLMQDDDLLEDERDNNANNAHVVESTLVDVHVDSTEKDEVELNPILMNVSASPLQPLKAHTFTKAPSSSSKIQSEKFDFIDVLSDRPKEAKVNGMSEKPNPSGVKVFNFDLYEQNRNQFARPLRKIDMSQIAHIENTKISKDLPPLNTDPDPKPSTKPPNINVYPNVTQTQLKVTDKKAVVAEQSTSSLSSDDSVALLQKQQLIRVAEWVEQNLGQQNNFATEPVDNFAPKVRRDSKNNIRDVPLKMPHPVTKYSSLEEPAKVENACITSIANSNIQILSNTIVKETVFPVECDAIPHTTSDKSVQEEEPRLRMNSEITAEELARMEYNVKKFLLSGSPWVQPQQRSRRQSHKTETDL